jgi:hypothetical protein
MTISEILRQKHKPTPPSLSYEEPDDETWSGLHRQALGALDTFREMRYFSPFYFLFKIPDSENIAFGFAKKEESGGFSITTHILDPSANSIADLPPVSELIFNPTPSNSAARYVSLTLTDKKYLSDADLALRKRIGIPSPGRKRYSWPRFREKREGFAEGPLGRQNAEILQTTLMLFECLVEKKTTSQLTRNSPYFFELNEGARPDRPASWKLRSSRKADARNVSPELFKMLKDFDAVLGHRDPDVPLGPGVWHADLVPSNAPVPCPGGRFYPLFFVVLAPKKGNADLLGAVLLSPTDDIESCVAECFRETLDQTKNTPQTVIFSRRASFSPLANECTSRGIEPVETSRTLPFTHWFTDDLADLPRDAVQKVFGIESPEPRVATVRIELEDASPRIYRDLRLPGDTTLVQLHYYIQDAFDWDSEHLFEFSISRGGHRTQFPKFGTDESGLPSELSATLQSLHAEGTKQFQYIYDYGDDWTHKITIRSVKPQKQGEPAPALIGGEGAAPPEDSGGIHTFCHLRWQIEKGNIKLDPKNEDNWMLEAIAEASFEFAGEEPLPLASNTPPPQNYEQSSGFFDF